MLQSTLRWFKPTIVRSPYTALGWLTTLDQVRDHVNKLRFHQAKAAAHDLQGRHHALQDADERRKGASHLVQAEAHGSEYTFHLRTRAAAAPLATFRFKQQYRPARHADVGFPPERPANPPRHPAGVLMENRQQRLLATLHAVLQVAEKWPEMMSHPAVMATLAELRRIYRAIAELQSRELPWRSATIRTAQVRAWCDVLREDHMMVIASSAALYLTEASGRPLKIPVPHRRAGPEALLFWAKANDERVRPHLPLLAQRGVSPDILDEMNRAATELEKWMKESPDQRRDQKALHHEMTALIALGRRAIQLLGRQIAGKLRENPEFRSQFKSAVRTSVKPGPPKERGDEERKRRKRPASHAVRAVPLAEYLSTLQSPEQRVTDDA